MTQYIRKKPDQARLQARQRALLPLLQLVRSAVSGHFRPSIRPVRLVTNSMFLPHFTPILLIRTYAEAEKLGFKAIFVASNASIDDKTHQIRIIRVAKIEEVVAKIFSKN